MENPVIPGRIQMERFIPVECFRKKKVIPSEVFLFVAFTRILGNFCTICPRLPVPDYLREDSDAQDGGS